MTRGRGSYSGDKPHVFIIADRGTGQWYVIPTKPADESTIQLLLADRQQESLTVYTDDFRAYESLAKDENFDREYLVHGDSEYADGEIPINTCESHHRGISNNKLILYLGAFQLRRELYRKPGRDALKQAVRPKL